MPTEDGANRNHQSRPVIEAELKRILGAQEEERVSSKPAILPPPRDEGLEARWVGKLLYIVGSSASDHIEGWCSFSELDRDRLDDFADGLATASKLVSRDPNTQIMHDACGWVQAVANRSLPDILNGLRAAIECTLHPNEDGISPCLSVMPDGRTFVDFLYDARLAGVEIVRRIPLIGTDDRQREQSAPAAPQINIQNVDVQQTIIGQQNNVQQNVVQNTAIFKEATPAPSQTPPEPSVEADDASPKSETPSTAIAEAADAETTSAPPPVGIFCGRQRFRQGRKGRADGQTTGAGD